MMAVGVVRIEKLMALTLAEFQRTIAPLTGGPLAPGLQSADIGVPGGGIVTIAYDPRPSVRFGGLLDMPRAVVSLTFANVTGADQTAFLARFDLAFRRGGG
jgi:hypothetical protein